MPRMNPWTRITPEPDALGESPFWHPQEQRLYWVDIPGRRIARVQLDGLQTRGAVEYWAMGETITRFFSVVPRKVYGVNIGGMAGPQAAVPAAP